MLTQKVNWIGGKGFTKLKYCSAWWSFTFKLSSLARLSNFLRTLEWHNLLGFCFLYLFDVDLEQDNPIKERKQEKIDQKERVVTTNKENWKILKI